MMEWKALLNGERFYDASRGAGDVRSELQRDYDRALFSSAVRRLQHKAQVFPLEPNDKVRNRLTHSHEVSCIARSLAERWVSGYGANRGLDEEVRLGVPVVCATVGLLHDLGNPPFGHAGEMAIAEWFERHDEEVFGGVLDEDDKEAIWVREDFLKFEGNAQTMRIILKLQSILGDSGLNLTYGTLSACRKYVGRSIDVCKDDQGYKKPGFFWYERERVRKVEIRTDCVGDDGRGVRHPLTYLVEAADDIVYSTVDLEDALSKGVLNWEMLKKELLRRVKDAGQKNVLAEIIEQIDERLEKYIVVDVATERNTVAGQLLRTMLIGRFIESMVRAFDEHYDAIMKGEFGDELVAVSDVCEIVKACKGVGFDHIYVIVANSKLEVMGRKVIHDLMDLFWDAVKDYEGRDSLKGSGYGEKVWRIMSANYRGLFETWYEQADSELERQILKLHLVTDYVCGMTDHYARELHRELLGW
ncbi:Deoxyguanosinetriphosphate triphosphohydrolase [Poriferisphaera corsica]|uniref:Deoxyguanosinetriphosphate triphosphohydrolase n=1 Tax=Poriferisphaera corsica TaxID=2528020 RepID=A0A517YP72_9BACT|nr:dNTP triphosphohydrolase [Poriferisphaera corsica]QDU32021.1 Deoxyguanosinetriphosphate triphosphohydrolase [Poriferisphaera corsica]